MAAACMSRLERHRYYYHTFGVLMEHRGAPSVLRACVPKNFDANADALTRARQSADYIVFTAFQAVTTQIVHAVTHSKTLVLTLSLLSNLKDSSMFKFTPFKLRGKDVQARPFMKNK